MAGKIAHTIHPVKLDDTPEWNTADVSEDVIVADKWQGNTIDRSEMRMLGRVQVLRVRAFLSHPEASPSLTRHRPAQFHPRAYAWLQYCPNLYLGAPFRVSQSLLGMVQTLRH